MEKEEYFTEKARRSFRVAVFVLIALFVGLALIQVYLYFNFLLGNDVAVRVSVDKEFLNLRHGEQGEVEVSAKVFTNPFCETRCNYSFSNLATEDRLKSGTFLLSNSEPYSEKYSVTAPTNGVGEVVYRFEILCASSENLFCYTGNKPFYQNAIIVDGYGPTDEELFLKNKTKLEISDLLGNFSYWGNYFFNLGLASIASPLQIGDTIGFASEIASAKKEVTEIKSAWEAEEYVTADEKLNEMSGNFTNLIGSFSNFKNETDNAVEQFDGMIDDFNSVQIEFEGIVSLNFSDANFQAANYSALNFISARNSFLQKSLLLNKNLTLTTMKSNLNDLRVLAQEEIINGLERNNSLRVKFNVSLVDKIELNESSRQEINFVEPVKNCCLFESCGECCESCHANESLYPIIFLHGHDFSSQVSAEHNLDIFGDMQRELEKDGVLNAGTMMINVPEEIPAGIWEQIPWPISVKMSYYFDAIREEGKLSVIQTKKDNIDTYSIRLKNIVDSIRKKTGKDKVILVTHSMGGLVARRYIELFGENDVDKLIMIASPNHGITESVYGYCATFGESAECQDMKEGSLFLSKLEGQKFTNLKVFNIVGTGCDTDGKDGDGVVQESSAVLEGAENLYVNGSCSGFGYLHSKLVEPDEYPGTYEIVKKILKN